MQSKKYVLIIFDGAGDSYRDLKGRSPFAMAYKPNVDKIARLGVCGRMQTLFDGLPKESLVAHLGMLGWDPRKYYPSGRASAELLAGHGIRLTETDLAFRANFVCFDNEKLVSYNGNQISTEEALFLVEKINNALDAQFPHFHLYHNSEFRNTLVLRNIGVDPTELECIEPHENVSESFRCEELVSGNGSESKIVANQVVGYLKRVRQILEGERANGIIPWSASKAFNLPSFADHSGFSGRVAMVGAMSFLKGIAVAGKLDFFKVGTGMPETNYKGKGEQTVRLLNEDYDLVVCHINGPDEASHMRLLDLKVNCIENIDKYIIGPVCNFFENNLSQLGGVLIMPDHYTNVFCGKSRIGRIASHSLDPVPFTLWNNIDRDGVDVFSEDSVLNGQYGQCPLPSLNLVHLLTRTNMVMA